MCGGIPRTRHGGAPLHLNTPHLLLLLSFLYVGTPTSFCLHPLTIVLTGLLQSYSAGRQPDRGCIARNRHAAAQFELSSVESEDPWKL